MPRRATRFVPSQYYHFYNRGVNRQAVFFERDNYLYFLRGMKRYLCGELDILAYCLMPTHYHILARIKACDEQTSASQSSKVFKTSELLTTFARHKRDRIEHSPDRNNCGRARR